ncbi:MAG: hypothetical protein ACREOJ_04925 [Gemmatimonadaceae bacterium]
MLTGADSANLGEDLLNPSTMTDTYTGLGQLLESDNAAVSYALYVQYAATEATTYDPLGNWLTRQSVDQWDKPYSGTATGGFSAVGSHTAHYDAASGRLKGEPLDGARTDTLRYDNAGNLHATLTVNAGSPSQYNERVSYSALDGRLVAADARSGAGPPCWATRPSRSTATTPWAGACGSGPGAGAAISRGPATRATK